MFNENQVRRFVIDCHRVPVQFPTHAHSSEFWEALGRCVATFGFLEETLKKAIFSFTATKPYDEDEIQEAYAEWISKLEHALTDQLLRLIKKYEKAVRDHPMATVSNLEELLDDLREASKIRNVICHGSWRKPDVNNASVPFFVNHKNEVFETALDRPFLIQLQKHVADLVCAVINTVTHMGWQFPSSNGPGKAIW